MEFVGDVHRPLVGLQVGIFSGLGYMNLAFVAYFFRHWRKLQLVLGLSFFPFLFIIPFIPESPRYKDYSVFKTMVHLELDILFQILVKKWKRCKRPKSLSTNGKIKWSWDWRNNMGKSKSLPGKKRTGLQN